MTPLQLFYGQPHISFDGYQYRVQFPQIMMELGPTFDNWSTANELALKVLRADQFCDKIPMVPINSPIPRDVSRTFVFHETRGLIPR